MKALSGYAEWFWLLAKNWKDVENRRWPLTRYFRPMELPVRVYLHASKGLASPEERKFIADNLTPQQLEEIMQVDMDAIRGTLFATVVLTGNVTAHDSKWFFGPNAFLCQDGVFLPKPIPYRGQRGFFEVNLKEV